MKRIVILLVSILCLWPLTGRAQGDAFGQFRQTTGDYSTIFCGKASTNYSRQLHVNHPYWETEELLPGTLGYRGRIYTEVPMRYDIFRKTLTLLPSKRVPVDADMRYVEFFEINGVRFERGEEGFFMNLFESERFSLTGTTKCYYGADAIIDNFSYKKFDIKENFTLNIDGMKHEVTKLKSFIKHFPAYKKQLKKYAKENRLDFKDQRRQALTALAKQADLLIKTNGHAE